MGRVDSLELLLQELEGSNEGHGEKGRGTKDQAEVKYHDFVVVPVCVIELFSPEVFSALSIGEKKEGGWFAVIFEVSG